MAELIAAIMNLVPLAWVVLIIMGLVGITYLVNNILKWK